jgi:alkanesulfonate monooxygenase SsuD/methylene tetrahydromethanopterin reductase-like flavin-dependent oxidoreductase (luciferase family)
MSHPNQPINIGLTDHLEGPADRPSTEIFAEVADLVRLADELGVRYAWFAEHHAHAHFGHLPTPLLFALHLATKTKQIHLGSAIICLNLHHAFDVAEQVAAADILCNGRLAPGFGSGSTPEEFTLFGLEETADEERHARFEEALRIIKWAWGDNQPLPPLRYLTSPSQTSLPAPLPDLPSRCWLAVNSVGSARIAGLFNFNMLFSHLRTPEQYQQYRAAYTAAGGTRQIAANRPVFVAEDDATAFELCESALRTLWRRFQKEGKISASISEPQSPADLCAHPINFIVGGPASVAQQLLELHSQVSFDVANVEFRWAGLSHELVCDSLRRLMRDVAPLLHL